MHLSLREMILCAMFVALVAAGAFILGSSIELSADAPLREPYAVWMQGGLNYHAAKVGVMSGFELLLKS